MTIRKKKLYDTNDEKPFKLSRSKIDNFLNFNRCSFISFHKEVTKR